MQGWIQGALVDLEDVARHVAEALRDAPSVERTQRQRLENQEVQRALEKIGLGLGHRVASESLLSIINALLFDNTTRGTHRPRPTGARRVTVYFRMDARTFAWAIVEVDLGDTVRQLLIRSPKSRLDRIATPASSSRSHGSALVVMPRDRSAPVVRVQLFSTGAELPPRTADIECVG